jgi:hypothetical protein
MKIGVPGDEPSVRGVSELELLGVWMGAISLSFALRLCSGVKILSVRVDA